MNTVDQFAKLVVLWDLLQSVHLSDEPDTIRWRWCNILDFSGMFINAKI
jgi:hypothetical protein